MQRITTSLLLTLGLVLFISPAHAQAQGREKNMTAAPQEDSTAADLGDYDHRINFGGSVGGPTPLIGLDAMYTRRVARPLHVGATVTLATGHAFAGIAAEARLASAEWGWRVGVDTGIHRIAATTHEISLFPVSREIVSAPNGVYLPYAGAVLGIEKMLSTGRPVGFQFQVRQDLRRELHTVLVKDWKTEDSQMKWVGGRTYTIGVYVALID